MAPCAIDYVEEPVTLTKSDVLWSEPLQFGGDDQWQYLHETKRFDLSRGSSNKLVIDSDDGVHHHRGVVIDPTKTVFVIIDLQNYFIHPDCRDHAGGIATIQPTLRVIERCRREGIQIAWLNWGIDGNDLRTMPPAVQRGFNRDLVASQGHGWHVGLGGELPGNQGRCLWKGSWNAQLYDPLLAASQIDDLFFDKNRPSGMWSPNEPLHRYLRESEKKTILFAGVNTDQCVLGTLTDAYSWGFDCLLVSDATATDSGADVQWTLGQIARNHGFVTDSAAFLSALHI